MKNARFFSLLIALLTAGAFLTACTGGKDSGSAPATNTTSATSPTPTPDPASPYLGAVDRMDCEIVAGWVVKKKAPAAETRVELYLDDKLIENLPAQDLRPDLTTWGTGRYGFRFKVPSTYKDGRPHQVSIKVAGTSYTVPLSGGGPPTLECKAS